MVPEVSQMLMSTNNLTIMAPSNDAFNKLFEENPMAKEMVNNKTFVTSLLQYHVMSGMIMSNNFMETPMFVPTMLSMTPMMSSGSQSAEAMPMSAMPMSGMPMAKKAEPMMGGGMMAPAASAASMMDGGMQLVELQMMNKMAMIFSGFKQMSQVIKADIQYDMGVVHVIDKVLTMPGSPSQTALDMGYTSFAGALAKTNMVNAVDGLTGATIFVPNNNAFEAVGSVVNMASSQDLMSVLSYHVLHGGDGAMFSTMLEGMSSSSMMAGGSSMSMPMSGETMPMPAAGAASGSMSSMPAGEMGSGMSMSMAMSPAAETAAPMPGMPMPPPPMMGSGMSMEGGANMPMEGGANMPMEGGANMPMPTGASMPMMGAGEGMSMPKASGGAAMPMMGAGEGMNMPKATGMPMAMPGMVMRKREDMNMPMNMPMSGGESMNMPMSSNMPMAASGSGMMMTMMLETLAGGNLTVRTESNGDVFVNSAKVVTADIITNNGVMHVLDK